MQPTAQVICIGNEIMLGHINNTNAQHISKKLSSIGIKTTLHISIPDETETIISFIRNSLKNADIVILTGGLGPTVDDLTLECISKAVNKKLIFNNKVANHIKAHFKKRRLKMPQNNLRQAFIPEGAKYILNYVGTAPGMIIPSPFPLPYGERDRVRGVLIALPGVPFEMYPILEGAVLPYLKKVYRPDKIIKSRIIRITGLPESRVNEKLEDILKISDDVEMGIYPHPEEITVKITATAQNKKSADSTINKIEQKIKSRLKDYIFGTDEEKLEETVGKMLRKRKLTFSIAESCTGGLLANRITNIPGSSKYFRAGIVAYSNRLKNKLLNVPLETIKKHGAVSKEVATLMAKNVRELSKTDLGIGISGIAGPGGSSTKKPVGLVYIAISTKTKAICKEFRFLGQRDIIKYKASQVALDMIRKLII